MLRVTVFESIAPLSIEDGGFFLMNALTYTQRSKFTE